MSDIEENSVDSDSSDSDEQEEEEGSSEDENSDYNAQDDSNLEEIAGQTRDVDTLDMNDRDLEDGLILDENSRESGDGRILDENSRETGDGGISDDNSRETGDDGITDENNAASGISDENAGEGGISDENAGEGGISDENAGEGGISDENAGEFGNSGCNAENENSDENIEAEGNTDEEDQDEYNDSEYEYSSDDIDEEEIDNLLEQGLPEDQRIPKRKLREQRRAENEYNEKEIIVLEEKSKNTFEVLPGGWIEVRHSSGMPLYLHRNTRVCTLAKPYFLGPGSVRRHSIPLSAVPCLAYQRAVAEEEKGASITNDNCNQNNTEPTIIPTQTSDVPVFGIPAVPPSTNGLSGHVKEDFSNVELNSSNRKRKQTDDYNLEMKRTKFSEESSSDEYKKTTEGNDNEVVTSSKESPATSANILPLAKVATAKENNSMYSITPIELREYCELLFKFKSVQCKRFKTWSARRQHTKDQKRVHLERPTLPEGVKLITFPIHNGGGAVDGGKVSKEYIMNPQGKSSVCILHEYVQHALRKQPSYIFRELENASTPYAATVVINNMQYGTGYGSSKKQAKADAAKTTLEILIPKMREQLDGAKADANGGYDVLTFFEPFGLNEMSISKWCQNFSEPPPYGLLLTCLQRNFGQGTSSSVNFEMIATGNQSNKFRMQVGEHSVEVTAANKREGKQLASQNLLAKLHPHINNFGAFIKLYGNSSIKSVKEKKQEEQQITTLQSKASANSPNWAILSKLKEEMRKLQQSQMGKLDSSSKSSQKCPFSEQRVEKGKNSRPKKSPDIDKEVT